jgi:hypothetical protein
MLMKFITDGSITHLSMYMASAGSYSMSIYVANADGSGSWLMRTTTVNRTSSGWATSNLGEPIIIDKTKVYIVCFNTGGLYFNSITAGTPSTFAQVTLNSAIVPIEGARYQYGDNINLFQNFNISAGANYYTDVVFVPSTVPVLTIYKAIVDTNYYPSFPPSTPSQLVDWTWVDIDFDPNASLPTTVATPNTLVARDGNASSSFGGINASGVIYTSNQLKNKVVVLWGDPANQDATDFYGFGINSATLRYNTPDGATHRFYVNTPDVLDINSGGMALNVGGLYLPTSGGNKSSLNYYEEYNHLTTFVWSPPTTESAQILIKLVRKNNTITALFPTFSMPNGPSGGKMIMTNVFPTRFRPKGLFFTFCMAITAATFSIGVCRIDNNGIVQVHAGTSNNVSFGGGNGGFWSFSATYDINF